MIERSNRLDRHSKANERVLVKLCTQMEKLSGPLHQTLSRIGPSGMSVDSEKQVARLDANVRALNTALHQMMLSGSLRRSRLVSRRYADLLVKGLADAGASTTQPEKDTEAAVCKPTLSGSIPGFPIAMVFQGLSTERKTGTLLIEATDEVLSFEVRDGDVVAASTNRCPREQRLGYILVDRGAVSQEVFSAFMLAHQDEPRLLGQALIEESVVSASDLTDALEQQVQQRFERAFGAKSGTFSFFEEAVSDESSLSMNVTRLLLESARQADESLADENSERMPKSTVDASRSGGVPVVTGPAHARIGPQGMAGWGPPPVHAKPRQA